MTNKLVICCTTNIQSKNLFAAKLISKNFNWNIWIPSTNKHSLPNSFPFIFEENISIKNIPTEIVFLYSLIKKTNCLIFAAQEHNSNFSAYFKNIFDWLSILDRFFLKNKKVFIVSVSSTQKENRDFEIVSRITCNSVGCVEFEFINWNNFGDEKKMNEILNKLDQLNE